MLGDDDLLVSNSLTEDLNGLLIIGGGERECLAPRAAGGSAGGGSVLEVSAGDGSVAGWSVARGSVAGISTVCSVVGGVV